MATVRGAATALAATTSLPPNLITNPGTLLSGFDEQGGWSLVSVGGSGGSVTLNTAQVKEGTGSLQLTTGSPATNARTVIAQKSLGSGVDLSSVGTGATTIRFWVYVHSDPKTVLNTFRLRLSPDASGTGSFANQFSWQTDRTAIHTGWNLICLGAADFEKGGNPTWSQPMKWARVEVEAQSSQSQTASVSFDGLRYGVVAQPAVIISFDDGLVSVHDSAWPIMSARGLTGTAYICSDWVGDPDDDEMMTLPQLKQLYAAGWDIANHTMNHEDLNTLTLSQVEHELQGCASYLVANGMPRGAYHVAYPNGSVNATVEQAMSVTGMLTGRLVEWRPLGLPIGVPYALPGSSQQPSELTLDQVKTRIDKAVGEQATIQFLFHGIGDPKQDPTYYNSADEFTAICDYIVQLGLPSLTISQFYALSQEGAVDTTPPGTTITSGPNGWIAQDGASFGWTGSDDSTPPAQLRFQYRVDGGSWSDPGTTTSLALTGLSQGQHTFAVRAIDLAGNVDPTGASRTFGVDTVAPTAFATSLPSTWTKGTVSVGLVAMDGQSGVDAGTATWSLDGGPVQALTLGTPIVIGTAGIHTVSLTVKDLAGNTSAPVVTTRIDPMAPVTTVDYVSGTWQASDVTLHFTATDSGGSGLAVTRSSLDGGRTWLAGTTRSITANGQWTVLYRSVDNAGNLEPVHVVLVRLDKSGS